MELKPIRNKKDYQAALAEVDRLWDAAANAKSTAADRLEVLSLLIKQYEREHFPVADPDPIEFLTHIMESRNLTRKDLEPYIGPRGSVRHSQPRPSLDAGNDTQAVRRLEPTRRGIGSALSSSTR